jgi:hypothetical protein
VASREVLRPSVSLGRELPTVLAARVVIPNPTQLLRISSRNPALNDVGLTPRLLRHDMEDRVTHAAQNTAAPRLDVTSHE